MISPSKDTASWYKANCVFGPTTNVYHLIQRAIFVGSNMRVSHAVLATHACRIRMHVHICMHTFTRTHQYPPVLRRFIGYHPSDSDQSHRLFACNDVVNIDRAELSDRSPKYIHHDMRLIVSCLLHVSYSMSDFVARHFYRFGGSCNFVFHGFQHNTSCIECHAF